MRPCSCWASCCMPAPCCCRCSCRCCRATARCAAAWFFHLFFQAEDGMRGCKVTGVQTCALPICTRALYAQRLAEQGVVRADEADAMIATYRKAMDEGRNSIQPALEKSSSKPAVDWTPFRHDITWDVAVNTAVPLERLQKLAVPLTTVPQNFILHSRVQKIVEDRIAMARGELSLDWGMAENLAYATLLTEGYPVRFRGQDSRRGTFFHRHATWHDQNRVEWHEGAYTPLQHLAPDQADFVVIDSLLSEEAVLGFEYGYATAET